MQKKTECVGGGGSQAQLKHVQFMEEYGGRKSGKIARDGEGTFYKTVFSSYDKQAAPMKSQQD